MAFSSDENHCPRICLREHKEVTWGQVRWIGMCETTFVLFLSPESPMFWLLCAQVHYCHDAAGGAHFWVLGIVTFMWQDSRLCIIQDCTTYVQGHKNEMSHFRKKKLSPSSFQSSDFVELLFVLALLLSTNLKTVSSFQGHNGRFIFHHLWRYYKCFWIAFHWVFIAINDVCPL